MVLAREVEPGQTVAASFNTPTLFVLAENLATMQLRVNLDEADVGQVKAGQTAAFTVDAYPGRRFPRSEEHTYELQARRKLVCRLPLEKKKKHTISCHHNTATLYHSQCYTESCL